MKTAVLTLLLSFLLGAQAPQQKINSNYLQFGVTNLADQGYQAYAKRLQGALTDWLKKEAKSQPQDFSWDVTVKPAGWNKVQVAVSARELPQRYKGAKVVPLVQVVTGCDDPAKVMAEVVSYITSLPNILKANPPSAH